MKALNLEQEANHYIGLHKSRILLAVLIQYYKDLEVGGVTIPDFMRLDTPEAKAQEHLKTMAVKSTGEEINRLYELCYTRLAEYRIIQ